VHFLSKEFVFDRPVQSESRDARMEFIRRVITLWKQDLGLSSALDLGCGVGDFSAMLQGLGLDVTAADAREGNIAEARNRHPGINFQVADAEDPSLSRLGKFDVVICFGLLYHLENPLRAFRNMGALTSKLLLLESMSIPEEQPLLFVLDEPAGDDQSLRAVSCYPSEGAMIKMAYRAGFPNVYQFRKLPDHEDFRAGIGRARARTVIAASVPTLNSQLVDIAPEPKPSRDLWTTDPTGITNVIRRLRRNIKQSRKKS
jgi:SAM-dependent methyltransferase